MEKKVLAGLVAAGVLVALGIAARKLPAPRIQLADERVEEGPRIVEPMQFLAKGAALRAAELDTWIAAERKPRFKASREILFKLEGCPETIAWLDGVEGQRLERLLAELRSGSREEAFASLVLVLRVARATEWKPGLLTTTPHANAERMGGLVADWLRAWGDRGSRDPLLAEPARAAVLVYGRLMRTAQQAPVIGTNSAAYERALRTVIDLLGVDAGRRTSLGEALQLRHPDAMRRLLGDGDRLRGLDEEARTLFPELDGKCTR